MPKPETATDGDLGAPQAAQDALRVVVFSPLFPEYAMRLATALGRHAAVLLIADQSGFESECKGMRFDGHSLAGMECRLHGLFLRRSGTLATLKGLAQALIDVWRFNPQIVHFQESPNFAHYLLVLLMKRKARVVVTVHDPLPHSGRDSRVDRPRTRARIRRSANLLLAHGRRCVDLVARLTDGNGTNVEETTHGVVLCPPPGMVREPVPGRVLMFGRMEAYKGVSVLLDAAQLLAERNVPCSIRLAGRGPELERVSDRCAQVPSVTVADRFLSPSEAIAEFQEASLVALPYLDATQSGVTAAAFANGRPVVASRVGGLVDVVADGINGLLVPSGDAVALADSIERAVTCPALTNRLRRGAEATAATALNWDNIASQILNQYRRLLGTAEHDASSDPSSAPDLEIGRHNHA